MGLKQLLVQSNHYMNVIMPNGHTEYVSYSLKIPRSSHQVEGFTGSFLVRELQSIKASKGLLILNYIFQV